MKSLIGLLFLSIIYGCLPDDGGFYPGSNQGAVAPDQRFPEDYSMLQSFFSQFEERTPTTDYTAMNGLFSTPGDIVTPSTGTSAPFLQNALYQNLMFSNSQYGLAGKTVDFDLNSLTMSNFYYLGSPPFGEIIPQPETEIPIGTIVKVNVNATIDGVASNYFQDTYMLKIQQGNSFWYVWYGNQNPLIDPQLNSPNPQVNPPVNLPNPPVNPPNLNPPNPPFYPPTLNPPNPPLNPPTLNPPNPPFNPPNSPFNSLAP